MAGTNNTGHLAARRVEESRSSDRPCAALARTFAVAGATTINLPNWPVDMGNGILRMEQISIDFLAGNGAEAQRTYKFAGSFGHYGFNAKTCFFSKLSKSMAL